MNNFLYIRSGLFSIFGFLFVKKSKIMFLLDIMKSLTVCLSVTLKLFRKLPVILKIVLKAGHEDSQDTLEKIDQ